jgi:hypothetical protein
MPAFRTRVTCPICPWHADVRLLMLAHAATAPLLDVTRQHEPGTTGAAIGGHMSERTAQPATGDDHAPTSFAEGAGFVRRLAIESGLTSDQADDVCFLTFQQAVLDPPPPEMGVHSHSAWLLRTAMEQCAVVRCLAWQRRSRVARHTRGLRAVSS